MEWERKDENFITIIDGDFTADFYAVKRTGWTPEDDDRFMADRGPGVAEYLRDYLPRNLGYGSYVCGYNGDCQTALTADIEEEYHLLVF